MELHSRRSEHLFGDARRIDASIEDRARERLAFRYAHARDLAQRLAGFARHFDLAREIEQFVESRRQGRIAHEAIAVERRHGVLFRALAFIDARHERLGQSRLVRAMLRFSEARHEMQVGREIVALREHGETLRAQAEMRCGIGKSGEGRLGARTDFDGGKRRSAGFTHCVLSRTARATWNDRATGAIARMRPRARNARTLHISDCDRPSPAP